MYNAEGIIRVKIQHVTLEPGQSYTLDKIHRCFDLQMKNTSTYTYSSSHSSFPGVGQNILY